jgi:hypothetical protein
MSDYHASFSIRVHLFAPFLNLAFPPLVRDIFTFPDLPSAFTQSIPTFAEKCYVATHSAGSCYLKLQVKFTFPQLKFQSV